MTAEQTKDFTPPKPSIECIFRCPSCSKTFRTLEEYNKHYSVAGRPSDIHDMIGKYYAKYADIGQKSVVISVYKPIFINQLNSKRADFDGWTITADSKSGNPFANNVYVDIDENIGCEISRDEAMNFADTCVEAQFESIRKRILSDMECCFQDDRELAKELQKSTDDAMKKIGLE